MNTGRSDRAKPDPVGDKLKVVISDYDFGECDIERRLIEGAGFALVPAQAKSEDELSAVVRDAAAVMVQYAHVGAKTIAQMERCRVIARYGVGVDTIDVDAATRRNILVTNVRDYCTDEVADHAMALLLALARKLPQYNAATHQGTWGWQTGRPVYQMRGRTMGLISFGAIGRAIAARGQAFGLRIMAFDPYVPAEHFAAAGAVAASFDDVIAQSDYLMVQVPLTPETRGMIGAAELRRMKPHAILVNTGRGPTVDNVALADALREGWIAAAGLDDIAEEPAKRREWTPAENALFSLDNVLITPHVAYYSEESIRMARETASEEVVRVLQRAPPRFPVNNVRLPNGAPSLGSPQPLR